MRRRNQKYLQALAKAAASDRGELDSKRSAKESAKKKRKQGRPLGGGQAAKVYKKALHDHRLGPYRAEKRNEQITSTNELGDLSSNRTRRLLLELRRANMQAGESRYDEVPYTNSVLKELMNRAKSATLTPFALDSNGRPILDEKGMPKTGVVPQPDGCFYQSLAPAPGNLRQAQVGFQEWDQKGNQVAPVGPMSAEIVCDPAGTATAIITDTATGVSATHPMFDEPHGPESILVSEKRLEKLGRLDPERISEVEYPHWRAFSEATGLVPYHPRYYLALGLGRQYPGGHTIIWGCNQTKVKPGDLFTFAWQNEIIGYDVTSGEVYRLCHTHNSGFSQPPNINVSQNGRFIAFTSDMMGTLGTTDGKEPMLGKNCRTDVFVVRVDSDNFSRESK